MLPTTVQVKQQQCPLRLDILSIDIGRPILTDPSQWRDRPVEITIATGQRCASHACRYRRYSIEVIYWTIIAVDLTLTTAHGCNKAKKLPVQLCTVLGMACFIISEGLSNHQILLQQVTTAGKAERRRGKLRLSPCDKDRFSCTPPSMVYPGTTPNPRLDGAWR